MLKKQPGFLLGQRLPTPIIPTLVIGVGRYGWDVGIQLVARLLLTEEGLRSKGLYQDKSLLACEDDKGKVGPGFVRVMGLNWKQWAGSGYTEDTFLTDIEISGASVAEEGTMPQQREDDMLAVDKKDAIDALAKMKEVLFAVSSELRTHDIPMLLGRYQTLDKDQHFTMRLVVVGAAREPETAALLPRLLELLGQVYVEDTHLVRGIQVICCAAATSRDEHRLANGDDREYDQFMEAEVARILPVHHRKTRAMPVRKKSLLDQLEMMWQSAPQQSLDTCYVIDTQLANGVTAVQLRPDEPNETIVVAALVLTMFITCEADTILRRARSRRWDLVKAFTQTEQGLFTSIGVGSYALDHPRLRRLVYDYVVGVFLTRAQPVRYGDQGHRRAALAGHQDDELLDKKLEDELSHEMPTALNNYQEGIDFRAIEPKMSKVTHQSGKKDINFKKAIKVLKRIDPDDRVKIREELERINTHMADAMEEHALQKYIQGRQRAYQQLLDKEAFVNQSKMLRGPRAPLVQLYRFTLQCCDVLIKEANKANAPLAGPDLVLAKRDFAAERSRRYDEEMTRQVDEIKRTLKYQPNVISTLLRGFTTAPLLLILIAKLSPLLSPLFAILSLFGLAPVLTSLYGMIATIPPILHLAGIALPLAGSIFLGHRAAYHRRLIRHLQALVKRYESLLQEADAEAWRWALAEAVAERVRFTDHIRRICRPAGIISRLRDELLNEQFIAREQVLERIIFDTGLQKNLKEVSEQLMGLDHLWQQRLMIFNELMSRQVVDKDGIKKWLREEAERIYADDTQQITDLVSDFFEKQTTLYLREMWYGISILAIPFLRHFASSQDDPTFFMEIFGSYDQQSLADLQNTIRHAGVEMLESVDYLRWLFLRARLGMHLDSMRFAIEAQVP